MRRRNQGKTQNSPPLPCSFFWKGEGSIGTRRRSLTLWRGLGVIRGRRSSLTLFARTGQKDAVRTILLSAPTTTLSRLQLLKYVHQKYCLQAVVGQTLWFHSFEVSSISFNSSALPPHQFISPSSHRCIDKKIAANKSTPTEISKTASCVLNPSLSGMTAPQRVIPFGTQTIPHEGQIATSISASHHPIPIGLSPHRPITSCMSPAHHLICHH